MDEKKLDNEQLLHCRNCDGYYDPSLPNCPHCGEDTANNLNNSRGTGSVTQYGGGFGESGSTLSRVALGMICALLVVGLMGSVVFGVKLFSAGRQGDTLAAETSTSDASASPQGSTPAREAESSADTKKEEEKPKKEEKKEPAQLPPEAIRLDYNDLTLVNEGETYQFQVSVDPEDWTGELTWTTDNQNVAVVTPEGKVKSVGRGECNITISAGDVSYRCIIRCKSGEAAEDGGSASVVGYYTKGTMITLDEAKKQAEAAAKKKAEEEAKKKAEKEAKKKAEAEAKKKAEEEAKKKAEEEEKRKAEEEARKKAEQEAEEEARRKAEKEAEEKAKKKAEREAKKKAEEEARKKAEQEEQERQEAERKAAEEEKKKKKNANSITLQYYDITLVHVGEGYQFEPSGGNGKSYSWSSANDGVASVTKDGYVKATGVGQTTVTCTSGDASVDVVVRVRSN